MIFSRIFNINCARKVLNCIRFLNIFSVSNVEFSTNYITTRISLPLKAIIVQRNERNGSENIVYFKKYKS